MSIMDQINRDAEKIIKTYPKEKQEAFKVLDEVGLNLKKLQELVDKRIDEFSEDKCSGEELGIVMEAYRLACFTAKHQKDLIDNLVKKLGVGQSNKLLDELQEIPNEGKDL